jgi:hypothetical protein
VDLWSTGIIMAEILLRKPFCMADSSREMLNGLLKELGTPPKEKFKDPLLMEKIYSLPFKKGQPF